MQKIKDIIMNSLDRRMGYLSPDLLDKVYTHKEIGQLIQAIDMI